MTRRLHILLAEDNPVNQRMAMRVLEKRGHAVVVAGNGRQALEAFAADSFDAILMDVQMPELDGLEATRAIRERERATNGRIPIVGVTAHAMKGDRERCLEAGMDGYLTKPLRPQELFQLLEQLIPNLEASRPHVPDVGHAPEGAPLDRQALLTELGGDEQLLAELAELFAHNAPQLLSQIHDAVQGGDAQAVERAAHALKGSASNFGARETVAAALKLEAMGRSRDLAVAGAAYEELEQALTRLLRALAAQRTNSAA